MKRLTLIALILLFALSVSAQQSDEFLTLNVLTPSAQITACQTAQFQVEVGNYGQFIETYDVSVDEFASGTQLSENPVEIAPGETKTLTFFVTPPCNVYGLQTIAFSLTNRALGTVYSDSLTLDIASTDIPVIAEDIDHLMVSYERSKLDIPIRNIGDADTTYDLFVEGPAWLSVQDSSVTVPAGEVKTISVISSPLDSTEEGDHELVLVAKVKRSGIEYAKRFTVTLERPGLLTQLLTSYGWKAYAGIGVVVLFLLLGLILLVYLHRTKESRAERREQRQKEKQLHLEEKEKLREQKRIEKERQRIEREREKEARVQQRLAAKAQQEKEREEAKRQKEAERQARKDERTANFIARKRDAFIKVLQGTLREDYLYLERETLRTVRKPLLPVLILIIALAAAAIGGYLLRGRLAPYLWYIVGGVLIVVLFVIALTMAGRLRRQRLEDLFESRGETSAVREDAKKQLGLRYYLIDRNELGALKNPHRVGASPLFTILFAALGVGALFIVSGSFAWYIAAGLWGLTALFFLISLVKLGAKKKGSRQFRLHDLGAGRNHALDISKGLGFGELLLKPKSSIDCALLAVHHHRQPPSFVQPTDAIFRSFELVAAGMDDKELDKSQFRFSVSKRWLKRNQIDQDRVRLERYHNNKWTGIADTKIIGEDDRRVTYESTYDGLGLFCITGKPGTSKAATKATSKKKDDKSSDEHRDRRSLGILLGLSFLIVVLVVGGILLWELTDRTRVSGDTTTIDGATSDAERLTDNLAGIDQADVRKGIPDQSFVAGQSVSIDLSRYFSDPEGDELLFGHQGGEDLAVTHDGPVVRLTNDPGYSGTTSILFTATDTKNQTTTSNRVSVVVLRPSGFGLIAHTLSGPVGILVLGLGIIVLILLGMELRRRLGDDELDEEY